MAKTAREIINEEYERMQAEESATDGDSARSELEQFAKGPSKGERVMNETLETLGAGARSFGNTAAFGYGPQIAGAASAIIPGGDDYLQGRDKFSRQLEQDWQEHPYAYGTGKVGGMLMPGVGMFSMAGRGVRAMSGISQAARAGSVLGGMAEGGLAGLLGGLVSNPGDVEGEISPLQPIERLEGGAIGTLGGMVLGGITAPFRRYLNERNILKAEQERGIFRTTGKAREAGEELGPITAPVRVPPRLSGPQGQVPYFGEQEVPPIIQGPSGAAEEIPQIPVGRERMPIEIEMQPGEVPGIIQKGLQWAEDKGTEIEHGIGVAGDSLFHTYDDKFAPEMKRDESILVHNGIIQPGDPMPPSLLFGEKTKANKAWLVASDSPGDKYKKALREEYGNRISNGVTRKIEAIASGGSDEYPGYSPAIAGEAIRESYERGRGEFFKKFDSTYRTIGNALPGLVKMPTDIRTQLFRDLNEINYRAQKRSPEGVGRSVSKAQLEDIASTVKEIQDAVDLPPGSKARAYSEAEASSRILDRLAFQLRDVGERAFGLGENQNNVKIHKRLLHEIYGKLRSSIYDMVRKESPQMADKLENYNRIFDDYFRYQQSLSDWIRDERSKEKIYRLGIEQGGSDEVKRILDFMKLGGATPSELGALRATYLSGKITENKDDRITFNTIRKLRNADDKIELLFGDERGRRDLGEISDLLEVANRIGPVTMNPSGTEISRKYGLDLKNVAMQDMNTMGRYNTSMARAMRNAHPSKRPSFMGGEVEPYTPTNYEFIKSRGNRKRVSTPKELKELFKAQPEVNGIPPIEKKKAKEEENVGDFLDQLEKRGEEVESLAEEMGRRYMAQKGKQSEDIEQVRNELEKFAGSEDDLGSPTNEDVKTEPSVSDYEKQLVKDLLAGEYEIIEIGDRDYRKSVDKDGVEWIQKIPRKGEKATSWKKVKKNKKD